MRKNRVQKCYLALLVVDDNRMGLADGLSPLVDDKEMGLADDLSLLVDDKRMGLKVSIRSDDLSLAVDDKKMDSVLVQSDGLFCWWGQGA
jgi:hypothetical protein